MTTTQIVLISLGVVIAVLTVVSALGLLPSLRIVPDDTHFDFTQFRRISFPISAILILRRKRVKRCTRISTNPCNRPMLSMRHARLLPTGFSH